MIEEILRTKLHAPGLPSPWIERQLLTTRLDAGLQSPLLLVSAPAGYGKSTSVAGWLESRQEARAWLSLDSGENDARLFVRYLVAAVQTAFEGACSETGTLLEGSTELPPISTIARTLANELDEIGAPLILVLDDYHVIHERMVHDLVSELIDHPPTGFHLILMTRRDPALRLTSLRAAGRLADVRLPDLQFDRSECARFLEESAGFTPSESALEHLHGLIEGWPAGLRLLSLALRSQADPESFVLGLAGPSNQIEQYLLEEVVAKVPATQRRAVVVTSIADRFCASLCEAICREPHGDDEPAFDGESFVQELQSNGLFAISLDETHKWYRYHHSFQRLLHDRLNREFPAGQVIDLHSRAARWFDENDFLEEAVHHALEAGDILHASDIVRGSRHAMKNDEQWPRLARLLARLPQSVVDADPALLTAQAWSCEYRWLSSAEEYRRKAEAQLRENPPAKTEEREAVQGEIHGLQVIHAYGAGDAPTALRCADRALVELPPDAESIMAYVIITRALALQSTGDPAECVQALHSAMERYSTSLTFRSLLLTGLSYAHWLEGDLAGMKRAATQNLKLGEDHEFRASIAYAQYLLGTLHYVRDAREDARRCLEAVIDLRYSAGEQEYLHAGFALSRLRLAEGQTQAAREIVESMSEHVLRSGNSRLIDLVRAFEAELDLRTGRTEQAFAWARATAPGPFLNIFMFYLPQLTLARVWLAQGQAHDRKRAASLLDGLLEWPHAIYNVPVRIEATGLRALVHSAAGEETRALETLTEALRLAGPGGFVRPFLDLGAPMKSLLGRLPAATRKIEPARTVVAAFDANVPATDKTRAAAGGRSFGTDGLVEHLTNRELDVVELLADRLRDKEIAEKLCLSPLTVKSHLKSVYGKLGVSDRREAVERARQLGILALA